MKKALLAIATVALLTGCASGPLPNVQAAAEPTLGAGDSLGRKLHSTDYAVTEAVARDRAFAAHPD
jgi:hypothetical protein